MFQPDIAHNINFGSVDYSSSDTGKYAGGTLDLLGYDAKDLKDADQLRRAIIDVKAFNVLNRSSMAALLVYLSNKSVGEQGHVLEWPAGDDEINKTTLAAGTGSSTMKTDDIACMQVGQEFLCEAIKADDSGDDNRCYVHGRVTAVDDHDDSGNGSYDYTVIDAGGEISGPTTVTDLDNMDTGDKVIFLTETQKLDGKAPAPTGVRPIFLDNFTERVRSSSAIGTHTEAHPKAMSMGLDRQMSLKWNSFMTRLNHKLYYSSSGTNPHTSAGNIGRLRGLPYFLKPYDKTATLNDISSNDTGMRGNNISFTTSFTRYDFEKYMAGPMKYSNKRFKLIVCNANTAMDLLSNLRPSDTQINQRMITIPGSDKIWAGISANLSVGQCFIIVDSDLDNMQYLLHANNESGSDVTIQAYNEFGFVIDPEYLKFVWADVPEDGGLQVPAIRDVQISDGDSRKMKEWNAQGTLFLKRPEAFGIFGLQ